MTASDSTPKKIDGARGPWSCPATPAPRGAHGTERRRMTQIAAIQPHKATGFMREKEVLRTVSAQLARRRRLRILSFGCSIGDEIASLRCIFPFAEIFACDVDDHALREAARTLPDASTVFRSDRQAIAQHGPYDLICAMSSLCIYPLAQGARIEDRFPFTKFEDLTGFLLDQLVPGGVFTLVNPSYLLLDTAHAPGLRRLRRPDVPIIGFVPVWNPDHSIALSYVGGIAGAVPVAGDTRGRDDWDFYDSVFVKEPGPVVEVVDTRAPEAISPGGAAAGAGDDARRIARWTRSNFDGLAGPPPRGAIEIRNVYELHSGTAEGQDRVGLVNWTYRDRIAGGEPLVWGPRVYWESLDVAPRFR